MDITLTMLLDLALPDCAIEDEALRAGARESFAGDGDDPGRDPFVSDGADPGHEPDVSLIIRGIRIYDGAATHKNVKGAGLLYIKKQKDGILLICDERSLFLETALSFAEVFNKLEEVFIKLRDWDMQLHQGIIEKKGLQYMLDVSADIFQRPISLVDSAYKLIAYSDRRQTGDKIFKSLLKKGYLPADAIYQLDKAGFIFEKKAIAFRESIEGLSYPMLNGTIFVDQDYRYMLTMLLPDDDFTDGVYEQFAFLLGQLSLYVEMNVDASRIRRFAWTSLLADLANGECGPAEFAERNRYSGLPETGPWRLVFVRRKDGSLREFLQERLEQALPGEIVFIHGNGVLVLLGDKNDADAPGHADPLNKIVPIIFDKNFFLCLSDRFETLHELHVAYKQTIAAYDLGLRISQYRTLEKLGITSKTYDKNVFRYSDYYPYDLISKPAPLFPAFLSLLAEDEKTAAGNLRLLYAYLKNDCSKTRTATELFMHRNNIIYRIGKLEEALGLSLADEQVKTAFRLSFLALELVDPGD